MSKFEDLGVSMRDEQGQEIPGATLITQETIGAELRRRAFKRGAAAGAAALAITFGYNQFVPESAQQEVGEVVEAGYTTIGKVPVIGDALEIAVEAPSNLIHNGLDTFFADPASDALRDWQETTLSIHENGAITPAE